MDLGFDYILTTRIEIFAQAVSDGKKIIVPSNIAKGGRGNVRVLDYKNWIEVDDRTHDSSAVIALKLLQTCGVKNVLMAGFDGFSININENYYDSTMRHPVSFEQAERRNKYYSNLIARTVETGINIEFITPSKYE